jgi:hypothetical protein
METPLASLADQSVESVALVDPHALDEPDASESSESSESSEQLPPEATTAQDSASVEDDASEPEWLTTTARFRALMSEPTMVITVHPPFSALRRALLGRRSWRAGLPLWLALAALLVMVVAFGVAVLPLHYDWVDGAQLASMAVVVPLAGALVAGVALLIRRRAQLLMVTLTGALLLVLTLASVGAWVWQPAIHALQAHELEGVRQWVAALHEYELSGESAPNAPNQARVHIEWSEDLLGHRRYSDALLHLLQAQADATSDTKITAQAATDRYRVYHDWLSSDATDIPYVEVIGFLAEYQHSAACSATCQANTRILLARANFAEGKIQLAAGSCRLALTYYQRVAHDYADTPYGKQASTALAAPVDVTGTIENAPATILATAPTMYLSSRVSPMVLDKVEYYSADYTTELQSSGGFTFHDVRPGRYNLSIKLENGDWTYWRYPDPYDPYTVTVQGLCPTNLQPYPWT